VSDDLHNLEMRLKRMDDASAEPPTGPSGQAAGSAARDAADTELRSLAVSLRQSAPATGAHLTPLELLAAARGQQAALDESAEWQPSEHLASCLLCFEAFEAILAESPAVSPATLDRYSEVFASADDLRDVLGAIRPDTRPDRASRFRRLGLGLGIAAVLVMGVMLAMRFYHGPTSAHNAVGLMVFDDGQAVPHDEPIPARKMMQAQESAQAFFSDGSRIEIAKDARLSIEESLAGDTTVNLARGTITARVAKQKPDHRFAVTTPLGEVIVVGTRFSVESHAEPVLIYQNDDGLPADRPVRREEKITAVTVKVFEGVVLVRNQHKQEARIPAGGTAVIRDGRAVIDVSGAVAP
jgi:ferric-dicitrate binding protein FerR (iron transport regulator)